MTTIKIKDDLLLQQVAEEMVLLEPVSGDYYTLNEVGAVIVGHIQKGENIDKIVDFLTQEFDVSAEIAQQDIKALIASLIEHGLAEEVA